MNGTAAARARGWRGWAAALVLGAPALAPTQEPAPAPAPAPELPAPPAAPPAAPLPAPLSAPAPAPAAEERKISLSFLEAPVDQVLSFYADLTGRTLIRAPGMNATVTLRGQTPLSRREALEAIDTALAMQNIALVPMGEKFLKVVQAAAARQEGLSIAREAPGGPLAEADGLVSQVIEIRHLQLAEIVPVLQGLIHGYGKIQPLDRANSLLVTDSASNVQRILEILEYLDRPMPVKTETRVYELRYAKAAQIATRLNELIADSQQQQNQPRVVVRTAVPPSPPGVIRAGTPVAAAVTEVEMAERGLVTGKVKIVADDRTNILIVLAEPVNFVFFDRIVAVLDRAVDPEVVLRVYALEFADAEEVSQLLNQFLGKTTAEERPATAPGAPAAPEGEDAARSQALREFIARRVQERQPQATPGTPGEATGLGDLSANTRVFADKRSNAVLLMGRRADITTLEDVIRQLDVMLAQVLIEAVILEVNLSDNVRYGIDWLQRSLLMNRNQRVGRDGLSVSEPVAAWGGAWAAGSSPGYLDGATVDRRLPVSAGALTYYLTLYNLNLDAVIRLAAGSSDARILSTPVVMTTDNTEAKILAGEQRPVVTSTSTTTGGTLTSQYQYKDIGVELTVTPRINPQNVVVMEVAQTADNVGEIVQIDGNDVPVITKRELKASIVVPNRATVALGGLVSSAARKARTKVPILGDIPLLGMFFRSDDSQKSRSELLVLITPYVLTTPEQAREQTRRLHTASGASGTEWYRQSDGDLARELRAGEDARIALRNKNRGTWFIERWGTQPKDAAPAGPPPAPVAGPAPAVEAPAQPATPAGAPPAAEPTVPAPRPQPLPWVDQGPAGR